MSKRFIDTGLYDDPWFMDLSMSGKVFWMYCITKCDHAGILELNIKLCQFQTGIKSIATVIKELGNRLISVREYYYFIPKFIEFQYPNFPNSKVRQQDSAIKILMEFGLFNEEKQTVTKGLSNSYESDTDSVDVSEPEIPTMSFSVFWNLYDKKIGDKTKIEKKWIALKDDDRKNIIKYIPKYKLSTPDKQYRKNPETFLNNHGWEDEIIQPTAEKKNEATGRKEKHEVREDYGVPSKTAMTREEYLKQKEEQNV